MCHFGREVWYKCLRIMKTRPRFSNLEWQALRTIRKFDMLRRGDHVLVAASGGADSTALLLCLHDIAAVLNLRLTVAHLNHGIRGPEAAADEDFIRSRSSDLGWPFVSASADLRSSAAAGKRNLEEAAREARYEFLRRAAAAAGATRIATGHHLNDQAETILFRLLRGSGPEGLSGIRAVDEGPIIRPLIECSRQQILEFLEERAASYRDDATNLDLSYRRNRIRHELLPYLETHFNPRLIETLAREAAIAGAAAAFLRHHARLEYERLRIAIPGGIALPAAPILQLHAAVRPEVIRQALLDLSGSLRGLDAAHIESILRLCEPNRSGRLIELPDSIRAGRELDTIELKRNVRTPAGFHYEFSWPGRCLVPEAGLEFVASIEDLPADTEDSHDRGSSRARLDPDTLPEILVVRSRLPGDRYGGAGHRKVKKMLLAARISPAARERLPMVADGPAVIWVPGFRPAKFYGAKPRAGRSVILEVVINKGV